MNLTNFVVKSKMVKDGMHSFCVTQRNAINASDNLKMVIGTAWIQNNLKRVAKNLEMFYSLIEAIPQYFGIF